MRNRIIEDLTNAMRNKDKELLSVIRMLKGAMQMDEINLKRELTDEEIMLVIVKQVKTRKESIVEFEKANRNDLIEKTQGEVDILNKYLPEQLSEEEVIKKVEEVFAQEKPTSMADMGRMMGKLSFLKGKADMGFVSKLIKERLS